MRPFLRSLFARQLRRVPAALCILAIAMQVALPLLHCWNEPSLETTACAQGGLALVQAPTDLGAAQARHDAASCPQCRLVSQSKSLSPLALVTNAPAVCAAWIIGSSPVLASSKAVRDSGAPRAPPVLA